MASEFLVRIEHALKSKHGRTNVQEDLLSDKAETIARRKKIETDEGNAIAIGQSCPESALPCNADDSTGGLLSVPTLNAVGTPLEYQQIAFDMNIDNEPAEPQMSASAVELYEAGIELQNEDLGKTTSHQ
ncbi:hypothetical protein AAL_01570 [Moelleriella libera RCEF 2490]|uniref:Uncharacterized protein n=1 Tax=Moelleriella libera RCEF 2490 TaxID=1081109 RepID=A0A166U9L9_9HYPO|nr:hypothetical protein AAL_01570 [Moelleriella libera RCEF 2490]